MGSPNFNPINPLANPYITNVLDRMTNGKEMRRLLVERQALLASLEATGLAQPATILNFNPVALSLDGGIGFKVPSILDESVDDADRFRVKYEGREYRATVSDGALSKDVHADQGCQGRGWNCAGNLRGKGL